jgi:undecaprenol kinase
MNAKKENKGFIKKRNSYRRESILYSFRYAIKGIFRALRTEKSLRIQLIFGILAIIAGFLFHISTTEWIFIILVICMVICLEMINTAFELIIDLVTEEYKLIAEHIKDIAAGTVLIASFIALIIGMIIFIPHIVACLINLQ